MQVWLDRDVSEVGCQPLRRFEVLATDMDLRGKDLRFLLKPVKDGLGRVSRLALGLPEDAALVVPSANDDAERCVLHAPEMGAARPLCAVTQGPDAAGASAGQHPLTIWTVPGQGLSEPRCRTLRTRAGWPLSSRGIPMADNPKSAPPETAEDDDIDRPRLTPQGRAADGAEDETDPRGGAKKGQGDKAEG